MSNTLDDGRDARCPQICNGGCDRLKRAEADLEQMAAWEREKAMHHAQRQQAEWDDRIGLYRCLGCGRVR